MAEKIQEIDRVRWTKEEWAFKKDRMRLFIQNTINELGFDNELGILDYAIASALVEAISSVKVAYRWGVQNEKQRTGRQPKR